MTDQPQLPLAIANDRIPVVFVKDGEIFADSRDVAAFFGKNHHDVLRSIDALIQQASDLRLRDFTETTYTVESKTAFSESFNNLAGPKTYRCVHMTRDGFVLLAMGFTGGRALQFKRRYIAAFNVQEAQLRERAKTPAIDMRDPAQVRLVATQLLAITAEQQKTIEAQAVQIADAAPKVETYEAVMSARGGLCLTDAGKAMGFAPRKFIEAMEGKFLYRRHRALVPFQRYENEGWFYTRLTEVGGDTRAQTFVTPKGIEKLSRYYGAPGDSLEILPPAERPAIAVDTARTPIIVITGLRRPEAV